MKKTVSLLLVLSLLLAMLAGCSSDSGKDKADAPANSPASSQPAENTPDDAGDDEIKVALIVKSLTNSFWMMAKNAAEAKGAELGITVEVFAITEETDYQAQVNTVEDCVNKNFDVIAIVPADSNALVPACKAAVEAGVKVLAIDTDLGEAGIATSFIGSDNVAGGKMAAEYVIDQIGTEGAIAVIRGSEAQTVEIQRYTGFSEEIAASSDLEIVAEAYANWSADEAANVMEDFLTAHPEIKAVFCESDMMVIGASQIVKTAGRDDIVLIGLDGTVDALRYVQNGTISADVAQRPDLMGEYAVEYGMKLAKGEAIDEILVTPMDLATTETVDELVDLWAANGF